LPSHNNLLIPQGVCQYSSIKSLSLVSFVGTIQRDFKLISFGVWAGAPRRTQSFIFNIVISYTCCSAAAAPSPTLLKAKFE